MEKGEPSDESRNIADAYRKKMVLEQIIRRGILDPRVLDVMRKVPRHCFIPSYSLEEAYGDEPLPIGYGQTVSQPYIVAYMTESLRLKSTDRVLEIGTGSGYQTAILAELAAEVYTMELMEVLENSAESVLQRLGYRNIFFRIGNGWEGWTQQAPFNKIIVTAAPAQIPQALVEQLAENGRMILPVGVDLQELIEGEKQNGIFQKTKKIPVRFVPLINPKEE